MGNFFTLTILSRQESTCSFNKLLMSLTVVDSLLIALYIIDSFIKSAECEPPW